MECVRILNHYTITGGNPNSHYQCVKPQRSPAGEQAARMQGSGA